MKAKVVKSIFMSIISTLFLTLCMTIAWFYAIREQNVINGGFNIVNLDAELYFFNYNISQNTDESSGLKFSGYEDDMVLDFTTSETKHLLSENSKTVNNDVSYFTKYVKGDLTNSPFNMTDVKPGRRFLFLIKAGHNLNTNAVAKLNLVDWFSKCESDNSGHKIYLSEAIYFYTDGAIEVSGVAPLTDANFDAISATLASNLNTNLPADSTGYLKNKFKDANGNKIKTEKNNNLDSESKPIPIELGSYTLKPNTKYIIPFIIEFSDDPNTFYRFTSNTGYVKDSEKGNSNVYEGLFINNIDVEFVRDF